MSTDAKPLRKQKQKEARSQPALNGGAERLKTVVRRLPPNLPEEVFWQSVQAWVTEDTVSWKAYYPGKFRTKRMTKEGIPSRAYIAFKHEAQVATFSRAYDGHVFRDKAGNESQAVVEFAPFQRVPTEKKKVDARTNTIDKDDDYLSFLETLKQAGKTESLSLEALIAASQPPPPPTTTPLLEALKAEKSAQRDREAILRNHAHYKDAGVSGPASKKDEAKKKAAAKQQATETAAPLSKKAKKAAAAAASAQKAASAPGQGQDGQGGPGAGPGPAGKTQAGAAPSAGKPSTPASTGHGRHRAGRAGKGDTAVPSSGPTTSGPGAGPGPAPPVTGPAPLSPAPATADNAPPASPASVPAPATRKGRPVIGLGRQFEAALSGAGVAVSQPAPGSDRKKRDKGGEPGSGAGAGAEGGGVGGKGKHAHREDAPVPSILQRSEVGTDVVVMHRPLSPKVEGPGHGPGEGGPGSGAGSVRGSRGRRGPRGRGHRGG